MNKIFIVFCIALNFPAFCQDSLSQKELDSLQMLLTISMATDNIQEHPYAAHESYKNRGMAHLYLKDLHRAIRDLKEAIRIGNGKFGANELSEISQLIGTCYYELAKYDSSLFFYDLSLEYSPKNTEALNYFIYVSQLCGDTLKTIAGIERSLKVSKGKEKFDLLLAKAELESWMNQYKKAMTSIKRALEIEPENKKALSQLKLIRDKLQHEQTED